MQERAMRTRRKSLVITLLGVMLAAFVLAGLSATPAKAEDAPFVPDKVVMTARELKEAVLNDAQVGTNYKIRLGDDIVLGTADDIVGNEQWGLRTGNKDITIDLNGHTMKHENGQFVINNQIGGTLELIDTSAGKTGAITNDTFRAPLIYNYGTLVINVNVTSGTSGWAMVQSTREPQESDYSDGTYTTKWAQAPKVIVKGGDFLGGSSAEFFKLIDSDLVIEGGNFVRGADYNGGRSIFTANTYTWSFHDAEINSDGKYFTPENKPELWQNIKNLKGDILDAYESYRGCNIEITGGNFTGTHDRNELIRLSDTAIKCNIKSPTGYGDLDMEEILPYSAHKVSISGGTWRKDYTGYCVDGKWMERDDDGEYYVVSDIKPDLVAATVSDGEENQKSFSNYDAAWLYATRNLTGERTITVRQDADIEQMNLWYGNEDTSGLPGSVTLDLNGHTLAYSDANLPVNGSHGMITLGNDRNLGEGNEFTLTVKDGSSEQSGELNIQIETASPSYEHGIHISNQYAKFVLESGTIRQTGYFPNQSAYTDVEGGNGSQNQAEAIFNIGTNLKDAHGAVVTIEGGNILSEIYFGTEENHGDLTASPIFIAWNDGRGTDTDKNVNFQVLEPDTSNKSFPNKKDKFKFELTESIKNQRKMSMFSWDLTKTGDKHWGDISDEFTEFTCVTAGENKFVLMYIQENENFLAGGQRHAAIGDAITAAEAADGVVSLLRNATINEQIELDGVTLDLGAYTQFKISFDGSGALTLKDGSKILNGTIQGGVAVAGDATLDGVTIEGNVTVNSGTLTITSGKYQGTFTFEDGANAVISGGSFKGSEISNIDKYFATAHGAYAAADVESYVSDEYYEVKIAPNLAARTWYNTNKVKDAFEIAREDEWNAFALYVSSGVDTFSGKTVKLTADLDFGYRPNGAANADEKIFFPAGNQTNRFVGTFDGNDKTIKGVHVVEINAGLFGGTGSSAKISNIKVENSLFEGGKGVGYFDEFNTEKGWVFVGGVIAQGNHGNNNETSSAENITLRNITIAQRGNDTNIMGGGYIGQTWSNTYIKNIEVDGITLRGNWKLGGIVGFTEASVTIVNGSVANFKDESIGSGMYVGSVMGQLVGKSLTLESCKVDAPESYLVGGLDAGSSTSDETSPKTKDVIIVGAGTNMTVQGVGKTTATSYGNYGVDLQVTVPTNSQEAAGGFTLNVADGVPRDAYVMDEEKVVIQSGNNEVQKDKNALAEGDKIVAGKSATPFDEAFIADGYCYMKNADKYEIREISEYNAFLLEELNVAKNQLLVDRTYSAEAEAEFEKLYNDAAAALNANPKQLSMNAARQIVYTALHEMNVIPTTAETLEQAKNDAKIELGFYAVSKGVDLENEAVTAGVATIDAATTVDAVEAALAAAKQSIDQVASSSIVAASGDSSTGGNGGVIAMIVVSAIGAVVAAVMLVFLITTLKKKNQTR